MEEPDKAVKIEKNDMQAASAGYEYETLMRLMGVSVSKHLLDQHFTLIWANEFYYKLIGWPKKEYEDVSITGRICITRMLRKSGRSLHRRS